MTLVPRECFQNALPLDVSQPATSTGDARRRERPHSLRHGSGDTDGSFRVLDLGRKVRRLDHVVGTQRSGAHHEIAKLAYVSRPAVSFEDCGCSRRQPSFRMNCAQEMFGQQDYVFFSVAKWRNTQLELRKAVIEIAPETPAPDSVVQFLICGSN